ncbi:MAG TPA: orotidine 5'-phosphate decarboxylase [Candidatus Methanomethylicus sp.]|nr:orotidine 5'-phosphate decarboxylase [Candidatus Methanomethylicus sp.]
MVLLQLALDFIDLDEAIAVAKKAQDYVDIMEAGTPLIKSCGIRAVRVLKDTFPNKKVVADMKTMDTGALEVSIAADAGADIVTVLAAADASTVSEAIAECRRRGKLIYVDTIGTGVEKIKAIERLAPDYICPHVGIDQQRKGIKLEDVVREAKIGIPMAVGGGINRTTAARFVEAGAKIIIVGNSITRASDVQGEAKRIREIVDAAEKGAHG